MISRRLVSKASGCSRRLSSAAGAAAKGQPTHDIATADTAGPGERPDGTGWDDFGSLARYEARWLRFFAQPSLDAFDISRGLNHAFHYDIVPTVPVLEAALRACRRANAPVVAARVFSALRKKCGQDAVYAEYVAHLRPVKDELGVMAPEEFGRL